MAKVNIQSDSRALYFVECDFGLAGLSFVEREIHNMDRTTTIADIAANQWGAPVVKVLEVIPGERICNDVTAEIMRVVEMLHADDEAPSTADHDAWINDRNHDHRKNWEAA